MRTEVTATSSNESGQLMESLINRVFANDLEGIRTALARGADPNERDGDSRTPLIHAAIDNMLQVVTTLLNSGAEIDAQDRFGNAALHYAVQEYHGELASLLAENRATVDIEDNHGNTPLWRAVFNSRGRPEMIKLLLKAGANKEHRNRYGKTPFDLAKTIANYRIAEFFD